MYVGDLVKEQGKELVVATAVAATLVAVLVFTSNFIASYLERPDLIVKVYGVPIDLGYEEVKLEFVGNSPPIFTDIERVELEQRAVDFALSDNGVKELIQATQYRVTSILRFTIRRVERRDKLWLMEWDGKLRALVTIIFTDNTGYYIEVNLTDETIEEIRFTQSVFP